MIKLISATSFSQLIGIIVIPLLTRLYMPESFGVWALFISIVSLIAPLASGNYEVAILLPDNEQDSKSILIASVIITAFTSFICFSVIWFANNHLEIGFGLNRLDKYIYLIPISIFLIGVYNSISFWLTREEQYGILAGCRSVQAIVNQGTKLLLGVIGFNSFSGLIIGNIFGDFVQLLIICSKKKLFFYNTLRKVRWKNIYKNVARYYRFPLFLLPSKLVFKFASELPVLMIAYFYPAEVLGYYAFGYKILWIPLRIVSNAVSRVLLQKATASNKKDISITCYSLFKYLTVVFILPLTIVGITAPEIFSFVLGSSWSKAGVFASLLTVWSIVSIIFAPFYELVNVFNNQHLSLIYNIVLLVVRFAALALGGIYGDVYIAVSLLCFVNAIVMSLYGLIVFNFVNLKPWRILYTLFKLVFIVIFSVLPVIFWKIKIFQIYYLPLFCSLSLTLYVILLAIFENEMFINTVSIIRRKGAVHFLKKNG